MSDRKVAIVSGASSGVGAATARLLASQGWNVAVLYSSSLTGAQSTVSDAQAAGVDAFAVQCDIGDDASCRSAVDQTIARWGRLDALVNSAGTTKFVDHADMEALSGGDFLDIYRTNVVGAWQMTRAAVPHLKASGHAAVVNVSSIAGVRGTGSSVAYATSKAALNAMTMSLARVLGPEIRVNTVCPGTIQGSWLRNALGDEEYERQMENWKATTPLRSAATPEDVAEVINWFIQGAGIVTGQILIADSGFTLGGRPAHAKTKSKSK
ncbi:SDR family NAD(P)-dependent oxidoreductase [Paraburkholderia tropica]|uniref:SDR family NAD(P)-dependent oxidoreductase n=1 Tax=Paraburkholderia tropica TaxID=92647 RepID=UPI002AB6E66B|nr:SDR family oxidoreductase [Paraburkholderia tropica]